MRNPMEQFLDAMKGLEKTRTPLDGETLPSTSDTALDSSLDPSKMSPLEMAEWWLGQSLSEDKKYNQ